MRRLLPLVLLLTVLLLATAAPAGEAVPTFVELEAPSVLVSSGIPPAIARLLPRGRTTAPLTMPLPRGPLLVIGLLDRDPTARMLAAAWELVPAGDDLDGGFVIAAWHDGDRPLVAVFADDPAALRVARHELQAAPARASGRLDFQSPPAEGGLRIAAGCRFVRPRHRIRAFAPDVLREGVAGRAAGARANRLWIEVGVHPSETIRRALEACEHHGVTPVLYAMVDGETDPKEIAEDFAPWRSAPSTCFALSFAGPSPPLMPFLHRVRDALERDGPVPELVLVPLHDIGDVAVTWGDPRLALERWLADGTGEPMSPRIPTRPWGREHPPGLDGIVVVGSAGVGTETILRDAWAPPSDPREAWEIHLLPLLPHGVTDAAAFLRKAATALAEASRESMGAIPWMAPLAAHLATEAERLPPRVLLTPRVPAGGRADGLLDEAAWRFAGATDIDGGGRLLAYADGRRLHLALRGIPEGTGLRLRLADEWFGKLVIEEGPGIRVVRRGDTLEAVLDEPVLGGAPYPTRLFHLTVERKGPAGWTRPFEGTLVLVP